MYTVLFLNTDHLEHCMWNWKALQTTNIKKKSLKKWKKILIHMDYSSDYKSVKQDVWIPN